MLKNSFCKNQKPVKKIKVFIVQKKIRGSQECLPFLIKFNQIFLNFNRLPLKCPPKKNNPKYNKY